MSAFERFREDTSDNRALGDWYHEVYPVLFVRALKITRGNRFMAEDLCHDAILNFVSSGAIRKTPTPEQAIGYLRRSIANLHVDAIRRNRLQTALNSTEQSPALAPLETLLSREASESVIASLSEEERQILVLMFDGESLTEIANDVGISYSNAGVRVHRIRNKIKEML